MSAIINQKALAETYGVSDGATSAIVKKLTLDGIRHFSRGGRVFTTLDAINNALSDSDDDQPNYDAM